MRKTKTDPSTDRHIRRAAHILRRGGLVAFPTETVYGLGANAFDEKAVCRVFEVKKRPAFDPLIVHVASAAQARSLWLATPPLAEALMKKFWPGPLSIVLPKDPRVPDVVTAGLPTVAVRMPDHRAALAMIRAAGVPVAAPSANLFGYTSPTAAASVAEDLGGRIDAILDGGPARVGVESTVVKIEGGRMFLLRPGGITVEAIEEATGKKVFRPRAGKAKESPGQLKSHYAPHAPLIMASDPAAFVRRLRALEKGRGRPARVAAITLSSLSPRRDLYQAAARLFQVMRKLDKMDPDAIVAGPFPAQGIGRAIADRLEKASGGKRGWKSFFSTVNRRKKEKER